MMNTTNGRVTSLQRIVLFVCNTTANRQALSYSIGTIPQSPIRLGAIHLNSPDNITSGLSSTYQKGGVYYLDGLRHLRQSAPSRLMHCRQREGI